MIIRGIENKHLKSNLEVFYEKVLYETSIL